MVSKKTIASILDDYEEIVIATVCSHSSLQIFHGARQEGFRTLGIAIGKRPRFYDAFPLAKPDDFLIVDSYADIVDQAVDLGSRQVVTVPHGSFVEYMGPDTGCRGGPTGCAAWTGGTRRTSIRCPSWEPRRPSRKWGSSRRSSGRATCRSSCGSPCCRSPSTWGNASTSGRWNCSAG